MPTETKEETLTLEELLTSLKEMHRLILWNDDVNTFEHVIFCMMKYLDYSEAQSEKIAWKVHNDGKCAGIGRFVYRNGDIPQNIATRGLDGYRAIVNQ